MAGENQPLEITIPASADLSSFQYRAVWQRSDGSAGTHAEAYGTAGTPSIGILTNKPGAAGRGARIAIGGVAKMEAGVAVAAGDLVIAAGIAGRATAIGPTTAFAGYAMGIAKTRAAASGDIFEVYLTGPFWVQR